ncbi:hypothetical protein SSPO_006050 [Streptomyces antimycoticus]|uniref:Uncharacterized protein n=1 Tax=Streptomyces antimycoticus TaxID=68175 RepID=A0A499UVG2_9ACTN|nr:hypothetical protein SSPO_006050 [Streptomyces antimycoticus]
MRVALPGARRPSRKNLVKPVSGLLRNPARGEVVHLMEQVETFQTFDREDLEGPAGESFEGARGHPLARAWAAVQ